MNYDYDFARDIFGPKKETKLMIKIYGAEKKVNNWVRKKDAWRKWMEIKIANQEIDKK